jgi:ABC-2 type transport system permease protein
MIRLAAVLHNSVVGKELRLRMRGWRSIMVLTLYMAILGIIAIAFLMQQAGPNAGQSSQVGLRLFQTMAVFQLFLILFITPVSAAGAISGERQRQTWDLLLVTRLSSFGIVWGKLTAALAFDLLLIVASLPLFSLVFLFGGVAPDDVAHTYLVFLATVVLLGTLSLCISALTRRLALAMVASNLIALLLGVGFTLLTLYLQNWGSPSMQQIGRGRVVPFSPPLTPLAEIDPLVALASALPNQNGTSYLGGLNTVHHALLSPLALPLWETFSVLAVVLSVVMVAATTVLVRSTPRWLSGGSA